MRFNPRAPCGARPTNDFALSAWSASFNPRAPCGARPWQHHQVYRSFGFQSTRPMRGATQVAFVPEPRFFVSIHAPHAGRDSFSTLKLLAHKEFQSTRPMRGATLAFEIPEGYHMFQSTRPMRGATISHCAATSIGSVSIHAPHAGRDDAIRCLYAESACFNPRAPCGARRHRACRQSTVQQVSIHAPHAGRDPARADAA